MLSNKDKYNIYNPKKRFGQNFLVDENISNKIISFLELSENDFVLEIGPGYGALTKHIDNLTKNYLSIEIDNKLFEELKNKNFNVINGDILKFNFKEFFASHSTGNIKVIGNIPYNITSQILFLLLDNSEWLYSSVIMLQKEVGERIIAKENTKNYGILSVQFQTFADVKIVYNIPRTSFFPKPNVDSAILKTEYTKKHNIKNIKLFKSLVREAFSKRRKTMKNSLNNFFKIHKIKSTDLSFDLSRRAESLSIEEFTLLYNQIVSQLS